MRGTALAIGVWSCVALTSLGQTGPGADAVERNALATSIANARETAGGREWDAGFRASFVTRLSALGVDVLRQLAQQGGTADLGPYIGYSVRPASKQDAASNQGATASQDVTLGAMLGDSTQDLVFTPIAPCRVINSVAAPGPIVVPPGGSTTKTYIIRGGIALNPSFAAQGGIPCDVPMSAAAVSVNFTVAGPSQPGHVIVDPSHLAGGLTSTLNFSPAPAGLNLANGVITPLCDFSVSACATDIKVTVAFGTTHFLADITGYFSPPSGSTSVAYGGTGQTTLTTNAIIYGQGTSAVGTAVGVAGQVLAGAAGPPVWTGSPSLSGNLTLVASTSSVGNIMKGTTPFIHNFGTFNTFLGENAGNFAMTGFRNTGMGNLALTSNTTGSYNTGVGQRALSSNTTGSFNTASGKDSLFSNTTGTDNVASGYGALGSNTTASYNTAVGSHALQSNTTGNTNTASGASALASNTTGTYNTANGSSALQTSTTGSNNTANGLQALYNNTTGNSNTASGFEALYNNTTGFDNTAIGTLADVASGALSNATAIGYQASVNASNKIRLGNASVTVIEGQVAYTFPSDRAKKENFRSLDAQQVLEKLRGMSVTSWNYIGHDAKEFRHYGPMAQDFFAAFGHDEVGVIGTETTINSGDITGILMIGLKGLDLQLQEDRRMRAAQADTVEQQAARIAELEQDRKVQLARIDALERQAGEIAALKQQAAKLAAALDRLAPVAVAGR